MPSVTDVQQPSSNTHGKSTPPPPSTQQVTSMDTTNADPITQAIQLLEKKQRNLGKRKEKLESYQLEAQTGKELHKDQKEALAKYPEVIGQIECVKELSEQFKKIQSDSTKSQKRLLKQAAEEKRSLISQRLREYTQIRYLLEHPPTSLKPEESTLLDELSAVIIPTNNSLNSISRSIDTVLSIYQSGPSSTTIKNLPGRNVQEVREILEQLIQNLDLQIPSSVIPPEQEQIKELDETNNIQSINNNLNDLPLQFDTRTQHIPLEQMIHDSPFFSNDLNNHLQNNNDDQSNDSKQYLQTFTVVNSNIDDQQPSSSSIENQQQDHATNLADPNNQQQHQQSDEQWQHQRGNGNAPRGGQFHNGGGGRPYRGRPNHYNQQWRGSYGGRYDNSYGGDQRPYYENNRGRGGSNSNYRGNRGGNYRPANRGYNNNNNGNGYQKPAQYQQNNNQHPQAYSAPPSGAQQ